MLKVEYIAKIRYDRELRAKIILITGISHATLYRWLKKNSISLTTADVTTVICSHLNVSYEEIIEPRKKVLV
jgi:predicted site-specific integrase-resolvase